MRNAIRPNQLSSHRRWGGSILLVAALVNFLILFNGCTTGRRYRMLSFFFDGVPDPYAPKVQAGELDEFASQRSAAGVVRAVMHKPYAENRCNECHENSKGNFEDFQKLESTICLKCHQKVQTEYPVMHGPVVVTECLLCHVPHESSIPHLLRDEAPAVCVQCHQPELLSPTPKEHLMPKKSCLDCHSGHGGPKHGLLKTTIAMNAEAAATTMPSTQPAQIAPPPGGTGR